MRIPPLFGAILRKIWLQLAIALVLVVARVLGEVYDEKFFGEKHRGFALAMKVIQVLFVLNGAWAANRLITLLKSRGFPPNRIPAGVRSILYLMMRVLVFSLALLVALDTIGISITPLIASLGVGSLAVALALQDTLGNLFSGFYMNLDRPIAPGDWIQLESGTRGQVLFIGWRTTRLALGDGNVLIIPNSKLASSVITNLTLASNEQSASVFVGVGYGSDLEAVEKLAVQTAIEVLSRVSGGIVQPPPVARFQEFGESAIRLGVFFKVMKYGDQFLASHEMIKALKKRFEGEGIEIPRPQRVIQVRERIN